MANVLGKIFGTRNGRQLKRIGKVVTEVNSYAEDLGKLSDDELKAKTATFKERLVAGETIGDILPEAFAVCREASTRVMGLRHFDVQLIGGMTLHEGNIAEMRTGEGKTLVATLPAYVNALSGSSVHLITVNDYLARRDSEWMRPLYEFLGLTVGVVVPNQGREEKAAAYAADIVYGTNNEFGFDYLRDNMAVAKEDRMQRDRAFAIIDEVDSILIDEARTPLIISGAAEDSSELYRTADKIIPKLIEDDFEIDEKARSVTLTDEGIEHAEGLTSEQGILTHGSFYDMENVTLLHHIQQALKAHKLFTKDSEYIVKDNRIVIIDEFTGRMMEGRRYSEGLHQALEAKEDVEIQPESQTLASITFQNYFRLYKKLSGMTGTAMTEASEFSSIYSLDTVEMPTNVACIRKDHDDEVYRTSSEKDEAILSLINECQKRNQPVLVGTVTIDKSEHLSSLLKKKKIKHQVLNARFHEQEANIIAQAGRLGSVTIATNMAGRGTDIQLGGNPEVRLKEELAIKENSSDLKKSEEKVLDEIEKEKAEVIGSGGLYIIGTERHESRRIDNQLRGRSGRQGDPGASKFFLSLDDDLMRIFGSERMDTMLQKLGLQEGEAIIHPWINKALEKAQQKVEARNFDIRKNLLRYDDVMNDQRKVIFEERKDLMRSQDASETIAEMREEVVDDLIAIHIPEKSYQEQWDLDTLESNLLRIIGATPPIRDWSKREGVGQEEMRQYLSDALNRKMAEKAVSYGPEVWRLVEKNILLQTIDQHWKEHLFRLDHLRHGIGLRAYAQRDPLNEYKGEAFEFYKLMLAARAEQVTSMLARVELQLDKKPELRKPLESQPDVAGRKSEKNDVGTEPNNEVADNNRPEASANNPSAWGKVSRNSPCPCNSGRKFKHCHGQNK